jgi:hypothetical protein
MNEHYCLYQITNLINGKIYVGVHKTADPLDGYLGSGPLIRKAVAKYGRENFRKDILETYEDYESLNRAEAEIVTREFIERPDTYNLDLGGRGGKIFTEDMKSKISQSQKDRFKSNPDAWNTDIRRVAQRKYLDSLTKEDYIRMFSKPGESNPMYGIPCHYKMTDSERANWAANISAANKGKKRTDAQKQNYSDYAKQRFWIVNQNGTCAHCLDINDPRLLGGEWQRGKKWKTV